MMGGKLRLAVDAQIMEKVNARKQFSSGNMEGKYCGK